MKFKPWRFRYEEENRLWVIKNDLISKMFQPNIRYAGKGLNVGATSVATGRLKPPPQEIAATHLRPEAQDFNFS
jgi:hypothetical protein